MSDETQIIEKPAIEIADGSKPFVNNLKWEIFCQLYSRHPNYLGNGAESYGKAWGTNNLKAMSAGGWRLLKNPEILQRVQYLFSKHTLNDVVVDGELAFVLLQREELSSKMQAIKEYNKMKGRVIDRVAHEIDVNDLIDKLYEIKRDNVESPKRQTVESKQSIQDNKQKGQADNIQAQRSPEPDREKQNTKEHNLEGPADGSNDLRGDRLS